MQKNKFPVDIFAVKEYGINKWQKDFFWPFSDDEFVTLYNDIDQCLIDEINNQSRYTKILLIIQNKFLSLEYANFLHALKVIQNIQSQGMDILYSNKAWWYKNFLSGEDIDVYMSRIGINGKKSAIFSETIKSILISILYNRNIFKYLYPIKKTEVIKLVGSINHLLRQYLRPIRQWLYFTSQQDWLPKDNNYELAEKFRNELRQCSKAIVNRLLIVAERMGLGLVDRYERHLEQLTEEELTNTAKILQLVKQKIKNKKKIHLLMPARGNQFYLTVGMAVQEYGGTVTNFAHGGETGFLNMPLSLPTCFDMPTVNNFVTYTTGSAELYERIKANHSRCENNSLNIISGESDEYFRLWKRYKKKHSSHTKQADNDYRCSTLPMA